MVETSGGRSQISHLATAVMVAFVPAQAEVDIRKEMLEHSSAIAYRFCPEEAAKALQFTRAIHARFAAHYGGDLVSFPDGLALAAAEQKRTTAEWQASDPSQVARVMREQGLEHPRPNMKFPPEFLNHGQGIGVFSNPDEGVEYALRFSTVLSGFRERDNGLTDDERDFLRTGVVEALFRSSEPVVLAPDATGFVIGRHRIRCAIRPKPLSLRGPSRCWPTCALEHPLHGGDWPRHPEFEYTPTSGFPSPISR
jgi:hypothetical protein